MFASDQNRAANQFAVGRHRPVYLWAGPGTIRMNRLKFMNAPVDESVHLEAHTPIGAARMADEAGFDWAYLMYNWGFPPEVEREDRESFRQAVQVYHRAGMRVFGYIQASNCVFGGSYRQKNWYALDPWMRKFYYYTGRYMTCWSHPDWLDHLRTMTCEVIAAGADGVFYDNPWHAIQPIHFLGTWMGPAGCYCQLCQTAYRIDTGRPIPTRILPGEAETRRYIEWRAERVTGVLSNLAETARMQRPDILVSCNNFDSVMRPSYLLFGIDLPALARVQDVLMIEDYGLPRWEPVNLANPASTKPILVNNTLTLRTARSLAGNTPVSTDPYDKGIGFDGVYTARRFQQGLAEAAACGSPMVVKGTEFVEDGAFTLLTAEQYGPQRQAIGRYHRWLEEHSDDYLDRQNGARIGLLYPGQALWQDWDRIAPLYFGAGQTLLAEKIPWKVVSGQHDFSGLEQLIWIDSGKTLEKQLDGTLPTGVQTVRLDRLSGWQVPQESFLSRQPTLRRLPAWLVSEIYRAYFRWRWARRLIDRVGLVHLFLQSPYFRIPEKSARDSLVSALGEIPYPRISSPEPVLVENWKKRENTQLHLVNYASHPQEISLDFGFPVTARIISPDMEDIVFEGQSIRFDLDIYTVCHYSQTKL
jgi:hypothetical protein